MDIFVGNLPFSVLSADVKKLFEGFGNVGLVTIVMSKDKKAPTSRGFGFVEMPDAKQAQVAIAALNEKEFMGRVLNVSPARPKDESAPKVEASKRKRPSPRFHAKPNLQDESEQKKTWFSPVFNKPGTYGGGRRTRSFVKRRSAAGMPAEFKPRRRGQNNPMRWRKRKDQATPWQKSPAEYKPWKKVEGESRPWQKPEGEAKPWQKQARGARPWKKQEAVFRTWGKPAGESKPWKKSGSEFRQREKPIGEAIVRSNDFAQSRTKSPRKPHRFKR